MKCGRKAGLHNGEFRWNHIGFKRAVSGNRNPLDGQRRIAIVEHRHLGYRTAADGHITEIVNPGVNPRRNAPTPQPYFHHR